MHINMAAVPEDLPVSAEGESREENRTEPEQEAQPTVPDMSPNDRKFMDKLVELMAVSYTHLTLPTNREV